MLKGNDAEGSTELVEREWLIQLLCKPITSVKGITEEQFNAVVEKYPLAGRIFEAVRLFI